MGAGVAQSTVSAPGELKHPGGFLTRLCSRRNRPALQFSNAMSIPIGFVMVSGLSTRLSLFDAVVVRMLVTPEPRRKLRPEVLFGSDARQPGESRAPGNFTFGTVL